jgi:hypothetical protein
MKGPPAQRADISKILNSTAIKILENSTPIISSSVKDQVIG